MTDAEITLEPEGLEAAREAIRADDVGDPLRLSDPALDAALGRAIRAYLRRSTLPREGQGEAFAEIEHFLADPADGCVNGISKRHLRRWRDALSPSTHRTNARTPPMTDAEITLEPEGLLPCPLCGAAFLIGQEPHDNHPVAGMFYIYHDYGPLGSAARKCIINVGRHFASREEAIAAWNSRSTHPQPKS